MPTGAGKTVCMAALAAHAADQRQVIIAHRRELVVQISVALARVGLPHRMLAPDATCAYAISKHVAAVGASWLDRRAPALVASVDTLLRRQPEELARAVFWNTDEGHHLQPANKWGRAAALMPRARGVGWTATPARADRRPLSRASGGCYDAFIQGPSTAELVNAGWLAEIEAYSLPQAIDRTTLTVSSSTGDFQSIGLRTATRNSRIVGDVVEHYLRLAAGLRGVTFCVDVDHAEKQAAAYRQRGVPAAMVSAETPDRDREEALDAFARGELLQLCNVDIFGEGTDCPEIGVISMARATQSLPLCYQQIGRVRRPKADGRAGLVLDHVGNLLAHGLPDGVDSWSLVDGPQRRGGGPSGTPVRQCRRPGCWRAYESWSPACPYCGWKPEPQPVRRPEEVEGDLALYGPELREELMRKAAAAVAPPPGRASTAKEAIIARHMQQRIEAQAALRDAMVWWAGIQRFARGLSDSELHRLFNASFGMCALTAQGVGGPEAKRLTEQIWRDVGL